MIIQLVKGDITKIEVDGIVNAANARLAGGGGVDGAIHRAGGKSIMDELDQIRDKQGGCPTGEAVITQAGHLPARKVIHAVGPVWKGGSYGEPDKLRGAYLASLKLADKHGLKSISFPNISTGVYGYPKREAALIAIDTVRKYADTKSNLEKVIFVCFDAESFEIYENQLREKGNFS
jgi:O-acetyl-ADP-ribose deacetylase (regulator of RNase III)